MTYIVYLGQGLNSASVAEREPVVELEVFDEKQQIQQPANPRLYYTVYSHICVTSHLNNTKFTPF